MQKAIHCVKLGEQSIKSAAKFYSILLSSLGNWFFEKTKTKRLGHAMYLIAAKKHDLEQWCFKMQEVAFLRSYLS